MSNYDKRLRNVRYAAKLHRHQRKPGIFCFHISCNTVGFLNWKDRGRAVFLLWRNGRYAVEYKDVQGPAISGISAAEFRQFQKELR